MNEPVKIGVVGGRRGKTYLRAFDAFPERAVLTGICDTSVDVLAAWEADHPDISTFASLDDLLEHGDCDAIYVATPMPLHAAQSIKCLNAGKHVLSSVIAATTIDECWELVETVEKTGLIYMMEEDRCYSRSNMMVQNMVDHGLFGQLTFAEGAYIANNNNAMFNDDGSLAWRGQMARDFRANTYPTHPLGPLAQWMGINRPGGDRVVSTATWQTTAVNRTRYAQTNLGPDHPASQPGYFVRPDLAVTLLRTAQDAVILIKTDAGSPRPRFQPDHVALQGTKASYLHTSPPGEDPLIWIEGRSSARADGIPSEWQSLWDFTDEYEHPLWRKWGTHLKEAGLSGGNTLPLLDFLEAISEGQSPPIDVYDAVTWSCLMPLSIESWEKGGAPVDVPDFARNRPSP